MQMIHEPNCILRLVGILGNINDINIEQLFLKKTGGQYGHHSYASLHQPDDVRPMENNMKKSRCFSRKPMESFYTLYSHLVVVNFHHENAKNISMTPSGAFPSFLIKRIAQADDDFISWRELMPGHICRNQQGSPAGKPWQLAKDICQPNSAINQSSNQHVQNHTATGFLQINSFILLVTIWKINHCIPFWGFQH